MSDNRLFLRCACGEEIKVASLYYGAEAAKCNFPPAISAFIERHRCHAGFDWCDERGWHEASETVA